MSERHLPITSLHELAAAARQHMLEPSNPQVVFEPAQPARRLAAAVVDAAAMVVFALVASATGFIAMMVALDTDFDGPAQAEAMGNWLLLALLATNALAYTAVEAFGWRTPGKTALEIRLLPGPGSRGDCYLRRWAYKVVPLIVLALVSAAGALHTHVIGHEGFARYGWAPGREVAAAFAVPAACSVVAFLWCFGPSRTSLYDRLARTWVGRPMHRSAPQRRAFEVMPAAVALGPAAGVRA